MFGCLDSWAAADGLLSVAPKAQTSQTNLLTPILQTRTDSQVLKNPS